MAVRVRQVTRTTQPQDGSPLNLSNSLARGIVAAYSFAEKGRNLTGDADLDGTIVGSMSYGPGGAGIGLVGAYQASNNYLSVPRTSKLAYTTQVTFEALVRLKSPQTTVFPYLSGIIGQYQSNSGGSSSYYGPYLRLNSDASSGNARQSVFSVLQGGVEHQITGPDLADGQLTYIIGTYDGSRIALFVNGVKYSASLTGAFDNDASNFISIGSEYVASSPAFSDNRCFNGDIYWAAIRDVGLTDAEGIALSGSLNPWQLFEPEQIVVKAGAAGTSTTTVTVDAGTLTLTGQSVTDTVTAAVGAGTVTLTGQNVALQQQQPVTAGATSLTGQSIGITITVPISPGTLSLTGSSVTVVPPSGSSTVTVDPGTLSLTGQAVTSLVTTPVSAGSTSLTGQNIGVTTTVNVSPGSITLTGQVVTVSYLGTQTVTVEPGTISVTGRDVTVSVTGGTKGGKGQGKNLTLKQKKKLKAVVSQEWLKAEQTVQELLAERLTHKEPAKVRVEKLTQSQSLLDVIEALKALSKETVTLPEQQAVIKTINKTITEKTVKQVDRTTEIEKRMEVFEKRLVDLEEMVLVALSEIL